MKRTGTEVTQDRSAMRPSSMRKLDRMRTLVGQMSMRDMDSMDIAELLRCSHTAARNYLSELLQAGVVISNRGRALGGGAIRLGFRLTGDTNMVERYLAALHASTSAEFLSRRVSQAPDEIKAKRHFHVMGDDRFLTVRVTLQPVRRDPLVAALFGAPGTAFGT